MRLLVLSFVVIERDDEYHFFRYSAPSNDVRPTRIKRSLPSTRSCRWMRIRWRDQAAAGPLSIDWIRTLTQPLLQFRPAAFDLLALDRDGERAFLTHQHDQSLAPRDARVDEVALEHHVMLCR